MPCVNERADERGAPVPADDVYLDNEVLDWPRAEPGDAGFDDARLESAVHDVGLSSTVLSFLVARDGRLVVEEYFNGADKSHAHDIFSTTKLLTTLAVGAAAEDGLVGGFDTTLGEWVEETADSPAAAITLQQLLSMRSGLGKDLNEPFSATALAPLETEPGSTYSYVTDNAELLALGLDRRVPAGFCRYLHQRVLDPLGVSVDHWHETPYGNVTGGSYAFLTPRELARLGQLLLDGGRSDGERLVAPEWVGSITEELTAFGCQRGNAARSTRSISSGAGMNIALYEIAGHEVWESGGFGGQAILVVPDLELVVVITQEVGPVFERRLSILDVLEFTVLPALVDLPQAPTSPCPTSALVVRSADGTERVLPIPSGGFADWSPDSTRIAFGSDHNLNPELYVTDDAGTEPRRLTDDGASDLLPRWSPDGTRITFVSDRGATNRMPLPELDLWLLDPETGQVRPLTEGFGDVLGHSWSPDGDRIVFTRSREEGSPAGDLWLVEVRTGEAELLVEGDYAWPEWSPGGESIAYVTTIDGEPFVGYLDLASGDHTDLAPGDFPHWAPDGASILVTRNNSILTVALDDRDEQVTTEGCCASVAADGQLVLSRDS